MITKIIKRVVILTVAIPLVSIILLKAFDYQPMEKTRGYGFVASYPDKAYYVGDTLWITIKGTLPDAQSYGVQLIKNGKVIDEAGVILQGEMREKVANIPFYDLDKGTYIVKVNDKKIAKINFK